MPASSTSTFPASGQPARPRAPPADRGGFFTVVREVALRPGEQYTVLPDELHWFQAGDDGAIVSEFGMACPRGDDQFTDPDVERGTLVIPD